jgi:methyl coenzyme M reductase subunit C
MRRKCPAPLTTITPGLRHLTATGTAIALSTVNFRRQAIRTLSILVLASSASLIAALPAHAGSTVPLPDPADASLFALAVAGVIIGWRNGKSRRD